MKPLIALVIYFSISLVSIAELEFVGIDRFLHLRDEARDEKPEFFLRADHITEIEVANSKGDDSKAIVRIYIKSNERSHTIHFASRKEADAAAFRIRSRILSLGDKG